MRDCVFCDIVAGESPAQIVTESMHSIEIVPLNPVVSGHTIVIPREHLTNAYDSAYGTGHTFRDASWFARLRAGHNPQYESVNLITSVGTPATQSVFHLHVHIVPRQYGDGLQLPWGGNDA